MTLKLTQIEQVLVAYANRHKANKKAYFEREFVASYGINVHVTGKIWLVLQSFRDREDARRMVPEHLLWTLYFLKQYAASIVMAGYFGCSDRTFRKWVWIIIPLLEELYERNVSIFFEKFMIYNLTHLLLQILFDHRLINDNASVCKMTVDGTDYRIQESMAFSPRCFSHKFKGPSLRYEIRLTIQSDNIV